MPPARPHLSITLPRNFQFHYTEGQPPKTPEPEPCQEPTEPPEPPRQTFRVRRRRPGLPSYAIPIETSNDLPIPTIEAPDSSPTLQVSHQPFESHVEPNYAFLAPTPSYLPLISPPRTPVAQLSPAEIDSQIDSISRPSSACSGLSDSSISSRGSIDTAPSMGGSCTSPESDIADPFVFPSSKASMQIPSTPVPANDERPSKRVKVRKEKWTEDMDNHLWLTYMRYLQDPTVTPFKMLPGTVPPLGICHRVVREAKKTWKGPRMYTLRNGSPSPLFYQHMTRNGSPDTIKPAQSGDSTPTAAGKSKTYPKWPRTDSSTHKRLRELCKRKPSLSAHYQRLLHCRTPSPFPSSPQSDARDSRAHHCAERTSPVSNAPVPSFPVVVHDEGASEAEMPTFSTRDMNISLATSTSSTMQADNPLMKLAVEGSCDVGSSTPLPRGEQWSNSPMGRRTPGHQKSHSLHMNLGSSSSLGSPFKPVKHRSESRATSRSLLSKLEPPLELHAPRPRSIKRRFVHEPNGTSSGTGNLLQELFGAPAESSHRRVRSRGFSLGDIQGEGARRLSSMFTPPSNLDEMINMELTQPMEAPSGLMPPPQDPSKRLGSPFTGKSSNVRFNNTFPRNFTPHDLDNSEL